MVDLNGGPLVSSAANPKDLRFLVMFSASAAMRARIAAALAFACAAVLVGCDIAPADDATEPVRIVVGTTDPVTSLDPAGAYDSGSFAAMTQLYPSLLTTRPGGDELELDIATSAEFDDAGDYVVTLKSGLRFANGNKLTSGDVKFSFDRIAAIGSDTGPLALLGNLDAVETPDASTIVFRLKDGGDQTFPLVLSSPAGLIVDEETFSADAITSDDDIVKGGGFAGPYALTEFRPSERAIFVPNTNYVGVLGAPRNDEVELRFFGASADLAREVREHTVDVAAGSLAVSDLAELHATDDVRVIDGPGGEIRYLVFDFDSMPFGGKQDDADPAKALAVRQAIADVVDREAISEEVYAGAYVPLFGFVASSFDGATDSLLELYGDGDGGPDVKRAAERLEAAGVTTPVSIQLHYTSDHYGESSAAEYEALAQQLVESDLFRVELSAAPWEEYATQRTTGAYPIYQLGTFPDYGDADAYLTPFFASGNVLKNHYDDADVEAALDAQRTEEDPDARAAILEEIQVRLAERLPTLPLLQGTRHLVVVTGVSGAVLDDSFALRFGSLNK